MHLRSRATSLVVPVPFPTSCVLDGDFEQRRGGVTFPFLPLPDKHYWDFRVTTVLGSTGVMRASDMVEAARWANRQRAGR